MKKIFTTALWLLALGASAQITNPGFETWTGTQPQAWDNSNGDGSNTSVISTTEAHSGSRAVELSVVQVFGFNLPGTISQMEIPVTFVPTSMRFWMESNFPNDAVLLASATVSDANSNPLAYAVSFEVNEYSNYTEVVVPFQVVATGIPTKVDIVFSIGTENGDLAELIGAVVRLDDVSLSNIPVNVDEQVKNELELSVFPNPVTGDVVTIQTGFTGSADVIVSDMTGKMVLQQNLQNTDANGAIRLDVSTLAPGMYTVSVKGEGKVATARIRRD
ncbi:MAG: T9SS type A sorting domain-containing protein [Flavobacteriales bacterium]